ncbi:MAG: hypothetical protein HY006_03135 [Candidatus Sungbacteria bacterium]|nr:hypothetical protein [Candidatus Sungbacteria bacterium]
MKARNFHRLFLALVVMVALYASGEVRNTVALWVDGNYSGMINHGAIAALMPISLLIARYYTTAIVCSLGSLFVWAYILLSVKTVAVGIALIHSHRGLPGDAEIANKIAATPLYIDWGSGWQWYALMLVVFISVFGKAVWQGEEE